MADPVDLTNLRSMTDGDAELEKALFDEFFSSAEQCIATLEGQCTDGANEAWRSSAHALKGTALNLGAEQLGALCKKAQEGHEEPADAKHAMLAEIKQEYDVVRQFLQNLS